ncbi:MAG: hypothetical protein GY790_02410 [Bacteroidetes bacterium]|nr:hypothetical protein [Bacteroidota bacterium]
MNRIGIIVAVESYLLRKGLVTILNRMPGVIVIREFNSVSPMMKFMQQPGSGLLVISQSLFDQSTELFITGGLSERTILLTSNQKGTIIDGQQTIDTGDSKEEIIKKIGDLLETRPERPGESGASSLSPRETTIVRLVSLGYTNKRIAEELFLSAHTVITHRKNIIQKLGIKSVSGLTVYAIVNNIITIEEVNSKPV